MPEASRVVTRRDRPARGPQRHPGAGLQPPRRRRDPPPAPFIEWLAEWGGDARRRQNGLLLLTAHRAKGLEFDHVVVLDGGWDRLSRGEHHDAPRRLYYVAMTCVRQIAPTAPDIAECHADRSTRRSLCRG